MDELKSTQSQLGKLVLLKKVRIIYFKLIKKLMN